MGINDVIVLTETEMKTIESFDERIQTARQLMETGSDIYIATNKALWEYIYGCHEDLQDYMLMLHRPTRELVVTRAKKK